MIVVSGVLTTAGKLEQLLVKKSPDPQVNDAVTEALSNWTFQPAQIGGNPVSLKILLGIRLVTR
jgi:outer membrane biosynthesis protein TonB